MTLPIWDATKLRSTYELALMNNEAQVILDDATSANNFRMALYNYRRRTGIGVGCVIECDSNIVTVRKIIRPNVEIIDEEGLLG